MALFQRYQQQTGAWQFEKLVQQTRARIARPIPTRPIPTDRRPPPPPGRPPPAPGLHETRPLTTLEFINAGRKARNEPLLTERDLERGPEQPKQQKIDPAVLAAQIVNAGRVARGEVKTPLPPRGTVAREIVLAGMKARGERLPEGD